MYCDTWSTSNIVNKYKADVRAPFDWVTVKTNSNWQSFFVGCFSVEINTENSQGARD